MNNSIPGRILVVDDQNNWRLALSSLLRRDRHQVSSVGSVEDAVRALESDVFDLLVVDCRLVDTDGFNVEGLELLRLVKSWPSPPKVIMLTGYSESIRGNVLVEYGADALVLKVPRGSTFDGDAFRLQVQEVIHQVSGH